MSLIHKERVTDERLFESFPSPYGVMSLILKSPIVSNPIIIVSVPLRGNVSYTQRYNQILPMLQFPSPYGVMSLIQYNFDLTIEEQLSFRPLTG